MRRLATLVLIIVVFQSAQALAHPPNAMHVNYDMGRDQLNVIVQHPVNDKWKHFVNKVVVYKNGREAWSKDFEFQTSFRNLTIPPIELPAVDGDEFRVVAFCSEGGKGEKTIAVGVPEKEITPGPIEHDIEK
jgi:hypothetical protein